MKGNGEVIQSDNDCVLLIMGIANADARWQDPQQETAFCSSPDTAGAIGPSALRLDPA